MTAEKLSLIHEYTQLAWREVVDYVDGYLLTDADRTKWFIGLRDVSPDFLRNGATDAEIRFLRRLATLAAAEAILRHAQEKTEQKKR